MAEVRLGPDGGWVQAFCYYCGWASQAKDMERACAANDKHERRHPEWTEPPSLEQLVDSLHADHDCAPGVCPCICGCRIQTGCTVLFGPLCSSCTVREGRGDVEHGEPLESPPSVHAVDPAVEKGQG